MTTRKLFWISLIDSMTALFTIREQNRLLQEESQLSSFQPRPGQPRREIQGEPDRRLTV